MVAHTRHDQVNIWRADARELAAFVAPGVDLVVTSPPYNVGIEYAAHDDTMPQADYLALLADVWRACYQVMAPGARVAVVGPYGVGRNPWRPWAAPVGETLTAAGFVRAGDLTWDKGTTGNRTTWGSFRLPTAPCLRDRTEAIIIASKPGRLVIPADALTHDEKGRRVSPWLTSIDFCMLSQNLWTIPPTSAKRVGHPAPFPLDLAARLIRFYAWPAARVLDPFAGSGTVGIAARDLGCSADLVEIDPVYCDLAANLLAGVKPKVTSKSVRNEAQNGRKRHKNSGIDTGATARGRGAADRAQHAGRGGKGESRREDAIPLVG